MDVEFEKVVQNLPENLIKILTTAPFNVKKNAKEIRLRAGRNIIINYDNTQYFFNETLTNQDIKNALISICGYSIHSHTEEIKNGFITLKGGHRAGICGTAVYENNELTTIKNISSINIRIARQINSAAQMLLTILKNDIGKILIIGPPASGKTTILKDIAKNLKNSSVCIIDSRGEIAACYNGIPQNDISNADVFDFYDRKDGIICAIKTMNPEYIICDEIGDENDLTAIKLAVGTGVKLIATMHGENLKEIKNREIFKKIIQTNAFLNIAILKGKSTPCLIDSIVKVGDIMWKF